MADSLGERVKRVIDAGFADERVRVEFPSCCGQQRVSTPHSKCKHGHLTLAVADETAQGMIDSILGGERKVLILISLPADVWNRTAKQPVEA